MAVESAHTKILRSVKKFKMKIGFTGTQKGMTFPQCETLLDFLKTRIARGKPIAEFHHGDCIGADSEAHKIARVLKIRIHIHPPLDPSRRAFCPSPNTSCPKPYLERNNDIINQTNFLVACPKGYQEEVRSGTWATIRYTAKKGKEVYIIYPNGKCERW